MLDTEELGRTDIAKYVIVGSGYSSKHIYKAASSVLKSIQRLEIPGIRLTPHLSGRRDDEWIMVNLPNIAIHLVTEENRDDIGIEHSLLNPPTEEEVAYREEFYKKNKKKDLEKPKTNYF